MLRETSILSRLDRSWVPDGTARGAGVWAGLAQSVGSQGGPEGFYELLYSVTVSLCGPLTVFLLRVLCASRTHRRAEEREGQEERGGGVRNTERKRDRAFKSPR